MFENPRRGRQARNPTTNVSKILDLKTSSEHIFSKIDVGCPWFIMAFSEQFQQISVVSFSLTGREDNCATKISLEWLLNAKNTQQL